MDFDILIIGSGPGGYVAAIRASHLGLKVGVIEKDELGGICLNWGCIPAKSLIKSARVYENFNIASDFGINIEGKISPDFIKIIERSRTVANTMSQGVSYLMKKNNIEVIQGRGKLLSNSEVVVTNNNKTKVYSAKNIILATGARTKEKKGIEIDGKKLIGYKEALSLKKRPESMIIIGSGAIGTELAYFYQTIGTQVTLTEYKSRIAPLEDEEISRHLGRGFKKRGVKILTNTTVTSVDTKGNMCKAYIDTKKGEEILEAELVLTAIGISPNIENLGIEELGIKTEKQHIVVDNYYKTNIEGIYAIGDIIEGPALAHVASTEGIICVDKIAGLKPDPLNYNNIPSCTYSTPEVASIGLTEKEAIDAGYSIKVGKFMFIASGKANATGSTEGMVKLIFNEKDGKLIGAHMVGENVTEMIAEIAIVKQNGITAKEIINSIHPHPSMSEAVLEAAAAAYDEAIHL
ncbi:dihydrolipoyl dehydrogenase [Bacteroidota bacterium]